MSRYSYHDAVLAKVTIQSQSHRRDAVSKPAIQKLESIRSRKRNVHASFDLPTDEALRAEAYWFCLATNETTASMRFAIADEEGLHNELNNNFNWNDLVITDQNVQLRPTHLFSLLTPTTEDHTMQAMLIKAYGENAEFEASEVVKPEPQSGHVLVKIAASSVNTVDTMIRKMGKDLPLSPDTPAILGMDFAGTVESVGEGVSDYAVGDDVYGCAGGLADLPGSLAEYMVADSKLIAHKPKNLSMKEAAALPLVAITAYEGLVRAQIHKGQKVLVHGGSGGVGHVAIQLAKHFGAEVYSTGGGEKQLALIEELGAIGINYKTESVEQYVNKHTDGAGFDLVYDSVGGANLTKSFEAAALNAHVATTVSMCELDLTPAHFKGLSLHVVFMLIPMLHNHKREEHGEILSKIAEISESGGLKPVLDEQTFSLANVGEAYARLESGKGMGKVVIEN